MGDDEEATVRTLTSYRGVLTTLIQQHNGKVLDSPGDNLLAEFVSVVDAVQCAVAVQKEIKARNDRLPENRRMQFRIGINLGDVIQEGERIYGDGVNIAARLESLANPGGICISKTAFDQIESKLPYGYEFLGDQTVKNIAKPVSAYRVLMEPRVTVAGEPEKEKRSPVRRMPILVGAVAVLVLAVAVGVWQFYARRSTVEPASIDKMAFPLPDKPSIAVLPFDNLSKDPEQEYFADGMTDDLITDLSKISGLFVIARNSSFQYKGKAVDVKKVSRELGTRYVLEGSVRRAGDIVRINAQLIDATTGGHLWAERYDGKMEDIFSLQDKITQKIVAALAVKLTSGEKENITSKGTDNIEAYDAFLQGREHYLRETPDDYTKARDYYEEAKMLDRNYWRAYAALAELYWRGSNLGEQFLVSLGVTYGYARLLAPQYLQIAMKNPTSLAHQVASKMNLYRRHHEDAIAEAERAIALKPNDSSAHVVMASALIFSGRSKEAIDFLKRAKRLDPHNPARYLLLLGLAQFCMGQLEEAVARIERGLTYNPDLRSYAAPLAVAYARLGRDQKARAAIKNYLSSSPDWLVKPTLQLVMYFWPFKDQEVADRFAEGLLKAGLPGQHSEYYKVFKEHQLSGEEIRKLFFGRKYTRLGMDGHRDFIDSTKDGKATLHHPLWLSVSGTISIEGDMLCNKFGSLTKQCGPVFRNIEGTPERKDEYLLITDSWIMSCSLVD
jgi:TolB-like protein